MFVCPTTGEYTSNLVCSDNMTIAIPADTSKLSRIMNRLSLNEGRTPILTSIVDDRVLIKDETRNPTGSFRDRAALPSVAHMVLTNTRSLIVSGDGNTCASYAAYAARAGMGCESYMPIDSDLAKVEQVRALGCSVNLYGETLDETHDYASRKASERGVLHVRVDLDPYALYGYVVFGKELSREAEDKGVDAIVLPVGSGATLVGVYTGLLMTGMKGVRLIGVQAGPGPYSAMFNGSQEGGGLGLHYTLRYRHSPLLDVAYKATVESGGWGLHVPLGRVFEGSIRLSTREGVFAEPASVAAYLAGLDIAVERDWRVMVLMTSTGLKTVPARRRILIGETKIDVLRLLNSYGRMHGYLIWKKLGGRVSPQAVYSALKWLESRGFISSYERGRYRFYGLTDEGRRILELLKYIFSRY